MANSTVPTKNTGDSLSASELNNIVQAVNSKVDSDGTKVLSDVNFSTTKDAKLTGIATGATANTLASQAEAEAGTEDTKYMSPLKVKQAIVALSPVQILNTEVATYVGKVKAVSNIRQKQILAIDNLVTSAKKNGWWSSVKDLSPLCGTTLAGAMIKLVQSNANNITNYGFNEGDYSEENGLDPSATAGSNKYLDLNVTASELGVTQTNCCVMAGLPYYFKSTSAINGGSGFGGVMANISATSYSEPSLNIGFNGTTSFMGRGHVYNPFCRVVLYNSSSQGTSMYVLGVPFSEEPVTASPSTGQDITGTIALFKTFANNNNFYYLKPVGITVICTSLTVQQRKDATLDIFNFLLETGRLPNKLKCVGLGDSITQGGSGGDATTIGGFKDFSMRNGYLDLNLGRGSSQFLSTVDSGSSYLFTGGYQKYTDVLKLKPDALILMYGTNDIGSDTYSGGVADPAKLTDMTTKFTTMLTDFKKLGCRIIVLSPPYRTSNLSKVEAYVKCQADVCRSLGITFVDTLNIFLDTGTPTTYFPDGLHPNASGYAIINNRIDSALSKKIFRDVVFDFPNILVGNYAETTYKMYTATVGQKVLLQTPITQGIIYEAYVSATDTVTIRATNISTSAIDIASQNMRITILLD